MMSELWMKLLFGGIAMLSGGGMLVESGMILIMHRQIVPVPNRILGWMTAGQREKAPYRERFSGKITPENLRTYAFYVLFFGTAMLISSLIYLNRVIAAY